MQTHVEKRAAFRIPASADDYSAALAIGKKVISAELIDYSIKGCFLALKKPVELEIGNEVRVATKNGQYLGIVRRTVLDLSAGQLAVGVKFTTAIENDFKNRKTMKLFSDSKISETADNRSGVPLLIAILGFWLAVAFTYVYFFQ